MFLRFWVKSGYILIIAQTGTLAAISLGLGYWLLVKVGLNGVGMAYALAYLTVALMVVRPLWKALKEKRVDVVEGSN